MFENLHVVMGLGIASKHWVVCLVLMCHVRGVEIRSVSKPARCDMIVYCIEALVHLSAAKGKCQKPDPAVTPK